jgi:hypothetical protein
MILSERDGRSEKKQRQALGPGRGVEAGDLGTLKGLKVLVADDNEVNVLVLTGFLREWGAELDIDQRPARRRTDLPRLKVFRLKI